jgi:predicted metalloprotease
MSDNSNPPPGRTPHEPEPEGEEPAGGAAPGQPRQDGQSPLWWTKPAEAPQEYLRPGGPGPTQPWSSPSAGPYPPYQQSGPQSPYPGQGPVADVPPGWQYPPPAGQQQYAPLMAQIPIPKPPGPGRQRKPRRASKGVLILVVALAVLMAGAGVSLALRGDNNNATTPVAVDSPSALASPTPTPSSTPTPVPPSKPTPKVTSKPKPKPRPPTAFELVARSKLYRSGPVQASRCKEPPFRPTTYAATKAYYNRLLPCLNSSWWRSLSKAGIKFRAPKVVVYAGTIKTPCGIERSTRGYYCGGNQTIYMPFPMDYKNYKLNPMYSRAWMLNTFAHEYGHHVQQLSGIFGASFARQATMTSPNNRLLESRRRELQAACLGSAYLGANTGTIPLRGELLTSWRFAVANAGDEFAKPKIRDHGSKANHNLWSLRGFNSKNPSLCNTWVIPVKYLN